VAIAVVLFPVADAEPTLEPAGLEELARLGVTNVALVRDTRVAGLVLEGWAFDVRDAHRAAGAVAVAREGVQTLRPLVQMSVSATDIRVGRKNVKGEEQ
jgi:hypothetical protein